MPATTMPHHDDHASWLIKTLTQVASEDGLDAQLRAVVQIAMKTLHAERGSLFLYDETRHELFTRVTDGSYKREIRIAHDSGIAGDVFCSGQPALVDDVQSDPRFNADIDRATGFVTRNMICVPVRTLRGEVLGVAQMLNKMDSEFNQHDLDMLQMLTQHVSIVLQGSTQLEAAARRRQQETEMLDVVSDASTELQLGPLLNKIIATVSRMLNAERSTLFLNDPKTQQLYTEVGQGLGATRIRFPNHLGIAGAVFTAGESINIPYCYADLRFNPAFDKQTGFFTRSMLCVPVTNKQGEVIGVTQALNKIGGTFTNEDEQRLRAFTAQISIGLENAKLFDDMQTVKNYNEAMLESMSNGVLTIDEQGSFVTANAAALKILRATSQDVVGQKIQTFFDHDNAWIAQATDRVKHTQALDITLDGSICIPARRSDDTPPEYASVNLSIQPLKNNKQEPMGQLILMEDISSEKRVKATMARYMDPALADKLIAGGDDLLGGASSEATVLFSDIRSFTTLTEQLGAQGTVSLLNEYFTLMVDCITHEGGMLDKFIGDAIMAVFGTPFPHDDDEDRAVRAGIHMLQALQSFNEARMKSQLMPIDMGLGINTDMIVSGNIGSPKRMDYTVIGDGVNLASRLEGACKTYGAKMLISERTVQKLKGTYLAREVDRVIVKGKTEPVAVYEVMDWHHDNSYPNLMEALGIYRQGYHLYRQREFDKAQLAFASIERINPQDKLVQLYLQRCQSLIHEPPPADWDGVFVMDSK